MGTNFLYAEVIRMFGDQVREHLETLVNTTDGVTPVNQVDEPDEMTQRLQKLNERGIKPPAGWKDTMDFSDLMGGGPESSSGGVG